MDYPKVHVATRDEAIQYLHQALDYLKRGGDIEHASVWIDDALLWMGERE